MVGWRWPLLDVQNCHRAICIATKKVPVLHLVDRHAADLKRKWWINMTAAADSKLFGT